MPYRIPYAAGGRQGVERSFFFRVLYVGCRRWYIGCGCSAQLRTILRWPRRSPPESLSLQIDNSGGFSYVGIMQGSETQRVDAYTLDAPDVRQIRTQRESRTVPVSGMNGGAFCVDLVRPRNHEAKAGSHSERVTGGRALARQLEYPMVMDLRAGVIQVTSLAHNDGVAPTAGIS